MLLADSAAAAEEQNPKLICVQKHEQAQVQRLQGELIEATDSLRLCASESCPGLVQKDCVRWLEEVQAETPSVVFEATGASGAITDVRVKLDEEVIKKGLDGRPVSLDPGAYTFTFEREGHDPKSVAVVLQQGGKQKLVSVEYAPPPTPERQPEPLPTPLEQHAQIQDVRPSRATRPVPLSAWILSGGAVAATVTATGFWLSSALQRDCSPTCTNGQVDDIERAALVGDVAGGIALVSATAAIVLYTIRPSVATPAADVAIQSGSLQPQLTLGAGSATVSLSGNFW